MADLARKMPESSHLASFAASPVDLANEKHSSRSPNSGLSVKRQCAGSSKGNRVCFTGGRKSLATSVATGLYVFLRRSCFAYIESCDERAEISKLVPL